MNISTDAIIGVALAASLLVGLIWLALFRNAANLDRNVDTALTEPVYAPYGDDFLDRVVRHQECLNSPCGHSAPFVETSRGAQVQAHCRCGNAWVCPLAGPLNTEVPAQRDLNRNDRRWS